MTTVTTLFTTNTYSSTSNTTFLPTSPSIEETLTLLVAGISTSLLMVALAVTVVVIIIIVRIKWCKSQTKYNQDTCTEQQEGQYATLIMGQVQQDGLYTTLVRQNQSDAFNSPNHPTDDSNYAIIDRRKDGQIESHNHPYLEGQVPLEHACMYATVDKQQPKEDTLTTQSNTVGVYYNSIATMKALECRTLATQS